MTQLSETVKELIAKARIISFAEWEQSHSQRALAIFQAADNAFCYLNDEELLQIQALSPDNSELIPCYAIALPKLLMKLESRF